jgi:hypothetical protein
VPRVLQPGSGAAPSSARTVGSPWSRVSGRSLRDEPVDASRVSSSTDRTSARRPVRPDHHRALGGHGVRVLPIGDGTDRRPGPGPTRTRRAVEGPGRHLDRERLDPPHRPTADPCHTSIDRDSFGSPLRRSRLIGPPSSHHPPPEGWTRTGSSQADGWGGTGCKRFSSTQHRLCHYVGRHFHAGCRGDVYDVGVPGAVA